MIEQYATILKQYNEGVGPRFMGVFDYSSEGNLVPLYDSVFITCNTNIQKLAEKAGLIEIGFAYESEADPTGISRSAFKTITLSDKIVSTLYERFENAHYVVEIHASENLKKAFAKHGKLAVEILISDIAEFQTDHEFAHQIQDLVEPTTAIEASIRLKEHDNTILNKHAREIDADWFATEQLAQRIANKFQNKDGGLDTPSPEDIEGELSIKLAAITIFFYRAIREKDLQLQKGEYPDPQIRKGIITHNIIGKVRKYLPIHLQFDAEKAIIDADNFSSGMFEGTDIFDSEYDFVKDVAMNLKNNAKKVENYKTQLNKAAESMPSLCMNGKAHSLGLSFPL